jgi:3'-5' exoribonuclease
VATLDLASATVGDRVQHELIVRSREDKITKNGDPFAVLNLGNSTGSISSTVWKEQLPGLEGVTTGTIVQVIGTVSSGFKGGRELKLTAPPRIVPAGSVDLDEFLPRITVSVASLWEQIDKWRATMKSAALRTAVDLFFGDDAFRAEFERALGAPRGHHALVGGLLLHEVEVATMARAAAKTMRGDVDLVTVGALLHDIGKVESYTIGVGGFDHSLSGQLLGHVVLGSLMLEKRLATLADGVISEEQRLELHHYYSIASWPARIRRCCATENARGGVAALGRSDVGQRQQLC